MNISNYLTNLSAKGYCWFTSAQAKEALGASDIAVRAALRRLKQKGALAEPHRGFHIIVPPEFRILGCLPADYFIHDLMHHFGDAYYVGMLSAAQYYGATHHQPQQLQIVTQKKRRPIECGRVKIVFIAKKNTKIMPVQTFNTKQGIIIVSAPEVTAMDLVLYPHRCGGIDNVFTILSELSDKINATKLEELVIESTDVTWVQRLGFLFDVLKKDKLSDRLLKNVANRRMQKRLLIPGITAAKNVTINIKWKLIINTQLEADI